MCVGAGGGEDGGECSCSGGSDETRAGKIES